MEIMELPKAQVLRDIAAIRKTEKLAYRYVPVKTFLSDALVERIRGWWDEQLTVAQIADKLDWNRGKTEYVVAVLRRQKKLPQRRTNGMKGIVPLPTSESRTVARSYKKRKVNQDDLVLTDHQRVILRILKAAGRPLAVPEVHAFLAVAKAPRTRDQIRGCLEWMRNRNLAMNAKISGQGKWFERNNRWFIPVQTKLSTENLTLEDAERETELATLIESQQDELTRGIYTDSEKGHWADKSLNMPLADEDGFTLLDVMGAEDENLADLMEEVP
jgi:Fe2+ or Zn2+ uptake regulation protein